MVLSSILDPVQQELPPSIFIDSASPNPKMRPIVREWLLHTIYDELEKFHPNAHEWATLTCTGSLTTYQWSSKSDFDLNIFLAPNFMPEWDRSALIAKLLPLDGTKIAGTNFLLQTFVVSPKITPELKFQKGLRSGYNINTNAWINPPDPTLAHDVEKEYNAFYIFSLETLDKLKSLIKFNPQQAKEYVSYLHRRRREEADKMLGDYGIFNIAWKMLDRSGMLGELEGLTNEHSSATIAPTTSSIWEWE